MGSEHRLQRFAHGGVAMQRQQQRQIGEPLQQLQEAIADGAEALTPVFASVHRGQDHPLPLPIQTGQGVGRGLFGHQQQGIDHGVAGGEHLADHAGGPAVGRRHRCGGEVEQGQLGDQAAVGLLREGVEQVVGAQTRLHMAHGDLGVEGRQGRGEGGAGVALHQHQLRPMVGEFPLQPRQGPAGHMGEGLLRGHQGQIAVGSDAEQIHHLAHHLPVLAREHHPGAEIGGLLESPDHRRQFDRLGPGAQHDRHQGVRHGRGPDGRILGMLPVDFPGPDATYQQQGQAERHILALSQLSRPRGGPAATGLGLLIAPAWPGGHSRFPPGA